MARLRILRVNPRKPSPRVIAAAARIIKAGGVVAIPTETVYGLAANPFSRRSARKIFKIKGRPEHKPLLLLISRRSEVSRLAEEIPPAAEKLMDAFWPGPLTLVFKKKNRVPRTVSGGTDTIGIRLSPHPVPQALAHSLGKPITAPSANLSGRPPHRNAKGVFRELENRGLSLILDAGTTPRSTPSTVVDVSKEKPRILREGAIPAGNIRRALR